MKEAGYCRLVYFHFLGWEELMSSLMLEFGLYLRKRFTFSYSSYNGLIEACLFLLNCQSFSSVCRLHMVFSSPRHLMVAGVCIIVMEVVYTMDFSLLGFLICAAILGFGKKWKALSLWILWFIRGMSNIEFHFWVVVKSCWSFFEAETLIQCCA